MFIIINPPDMKIVPGVNTVNYSPKSYSRQWKNDKSEIKNGFHIWLTKVIVVIK